MFQLKRQLGSSFSRANSLRPFHKSLRTLFISTTLCFGSLSFILILRVAQKGIAKITIDTIGSSVLAIGFALIAAMALISFVVDSIRWKWLTQNSTQDFKLLLAANPKSFRYAAIPEQHRGMIIGAIFFGGASIVATIGVILS